MTLAAMMAVNLLVGACVGLTGIAGFLLPMFYTGFLSMPASASLALSFAAFLVSGITGSFHYYKSGNLELKTAGSLSAGSLIGAAAGVKINLLIPEETIKIILYLVVLGSGISILIRGRNRKTEQKEWKTGTQTEGKTGVLFYVLLGAVTGAVCAASGAGGPVLVMPLLTLIGFEAHTAVGIALFNSIFIAVPSVAGYLYQASSDRQIFLLLPVLLAAHAAGVICGSKNAVRIDQELLKKIVASGSILIACIKLLF